MSADNNDINDHTVADNIRDKQREKRSKYGSDKEQYGGGERPDEDYDEEYGQYEAWGEGSGDSAGGFDPRKDYKGDTKEEVKHEKWKARQQYKDNLKQQGAFNTKTKIGYDKFEAFMEKWDDQPEGVWLSKNKCVSALSAMYREGGIERSTGNILSDCNQIAESMGGAGLTKAKKRVREARYEEEAKIEDDVIKLVGIAQDSGKFSEEQLSEIKTKGTMEQQKRAIIKLLGSDKGTKVSMMDTLKVKVGKGGIEQQMNVLLAQAKNPQTKSGKRSKAIAKLETLQQTAIASGVDVPPGVTSYLAVIGEQDLETEIGEDDEKEDRLAGVKGMASELGAGLVSRVAGSGGDDIDVDEFGERSSGGGFGSKLGDSHIEMDTDQIGSRGGGITELFGGVGVGAVPTSLKSKVLGKETIGSGDLFESSITASKAGVDLGDWSPRAYDVPEGGETRGERFLRKRSAPTTGEAGPLGGDLTPGSMSFDFRSGRGPGSARLDLGAGQFTPSTPINLGTQRKPDQPRASINLGLNASQRPSTGINLLGTRTNVGVKAPDVNSIVKETNIPTNRPMAGGGISMNAKPGIDKGHLLGTPPKKKRKMNLFGGLPR